MKLTGKRIIIREHKEEDLEFYHYLMSDPESMFYLQDLKTSNLDESRISLNIAIEEAKKGSDRTKYFWGIFLTDETYIGEIGYTLSSMDDNGSKCVNLGYFIHRDYWNNGYVSEALKLVIDYAFKIDSVIKIETGCLTGNKYSERLMQKTGFIREAYKRNHQFMSGKWYDRVEYSLFKEDFLKETLFPLPITKLPAADISLDGIRAFLSQGSDHQIIFMEFENDVELPEHKHESQVGFVLRGKIDLKIDGVMKTYSKGDIYYIPKNILHSGYIYSGYADITFFNEKNRYGIRTK